MELGVYVWEDGVADFHDGAGDAGGGGEYIGFLGLGGDDVVVAVESLNFK